MQTHPRIVLKYCMRCGSDAVGYQKGDAIQCAACDFRYYINSAAAVAVLIVDAKGRLLLTQRACDPGKDLWDLPGGFVDIGEQAEEAVERELQEELNVRVQTIQYLGSYPNEYVYSGLTIYTLDMAFVCKIRDFSTITAKDDVVAYRFFPLQTINFNEIAFDSIRTIIKDFVKHKTN